MNSTKDFLHQRGDSQMTISHNFAMSWHEVQHIDETVLVVEKRKSRTWERCISIHVCICFSKLLHPFVFFLANYKGRRGASRLLHIWIQHISYCIIKSVCLPGVKYLSRTHVKSHVVQSFSEKVFSVASSARVRCAYFINQPRQAEALIVLLGLLFICCRPPVFRRTSSFFLFCFVLNISVTNELISLHYTPISLMGKLLNFTAAN